MFVSSDQAQSIQLPLKGVPAEHPLTHDLLVEVLTGFGGSIDEVRVDDLVVGDIRLRRRDVLKIHPRFGLVLD